MKAEEIAVELIDLDPDNPRVPDYIGRTQADLLAYIYDRGSLSELADSRPPDIERRAALVTSRYPPDHAWQVR